MSTESGGSARICRAIRECRLLACDYKGKPRVIAPYCLGLSQRGSQMLRAVQVGGASHSNGFGFGKLWTVADIENLRLLDETFVADDPDYNPDDSAMKSIICRVPPRRGKGAGK
jgi:hypothetical protein